MGKATPEPWLSGQDQNKNSKNFKNRIFQTYPPIWELCPVEIRILGQITLLANDLVAKVLTLQRTNDLKNKILPQHGLVLDYDSELVWIPPKSKFDDFCALKNVSVKLLDPESALVSKAVKAKQKNRVLVVDAIACPS